MLEQTTLGGSFSPPGTSFTVNRMGYGAMQIAGPDVFGPPRGTLISPSLSCAGNRFWRDHIDSSDYYGPHVTNQII